MDCSNLCGQYKKYIAKATDEIDIEAVSFDGEEEITADDLASLKQLILETL